MCHSYREKNLERFISSGIHVVVAAKFSCRQTEVRGLGFAMGAAPNSEPLSSVWQRNPTCQHHGCSCHPYYHGIINATVKLYLCEMTLYLERIFYRYRVHWVRNNRYCWICCASLQDLWAELQDSRSPKVHPPVTVQTGSVVQGVELSWVIFRKEVLQPIFVWHVITTRLYFLST